MTFRTDTKPVIGFRQFSHAGNAYIERNQEILARLGAVANVPRARELAIILVRRLLSLRSCKIYDVLIVGWAENVLIDRGGRLTLRGRLEYRIFLWICRRLSRSLVYVRHNTLPHNARTLDARRLAVLISKGQGRADAIVAHSPVFRTEAACHYVPHPLYDVSPAAQSRADCYVVFGRIQPYKNIDVLVEAWSGPSELLILGPCDDHGYLAKLKALASGKPVRFDVGFKSEAEIAVRISAAAGVIIVNDPASAIVSGSLFFALSCGSRVFVLQTPFHDWLATTPLGDVVQIFETIPALVAGVAQDDLAAAPDNASIRAEAEKLFGDDRVARGWQAVIATLVDQTTAESDGRS